MSMPFLGKRFSIEVDSLKESNIELLNRIENLEGKINKGKEIMVEKVVVASAKEIEGKLVGELVSVSTGDEMDKVYASLPDLGEELGGVASDSVVN